MLAHIVRWPDGRYEARYFAHLLLGTWPDGNEEWDWVRHRHQTATFADTLDAARAIALAEIAAMADDPALSQRFNPNTLFPNP